MSWRDELLDVSERRAIPQAFEVQPAGNNIAKITGYASVFDRGYDVHGGPSGGGWTETVTRSAFKRTLSENPHVHLLINHAQDGGLPLASTKSGTLRLSTDSTGLITESQVDRRNSRANDLVLTLERGDADEMSFAFRVKQNTWSDDDAQRSLDEVSLHKGDVSVVGFGANPFTSVGVRNAVRMLARDDFSDKELAELRAMSEQVDRAMIRLQDARTDAPLTPGSHHADPGFLDRDGKPANGGDGVPRYQIDDAAHVRDALSRFSANKGEYTPDQQDQILAAIRSAAKKFGVEVEKNHEQLVGIVRRALSPGSDGGFEDGDDDDYRGGTPLAQAIHDMCAEAGADCGDETQIPAEPNGSRATKNPDVSTTGQNLRVSDVAAKLYDGNLTVANALRMCRPEDSQDPLSVDAAIQLAS